MPARKYKIEIIAGNNQSDTVGKKLPDSVKIRILVNDMPLAKCKIHVVQQSCIFTKKDMVITDSNGIASYSWELTPTIGNQVIQLFIRDSTNSILDSIVANAKGLYFEHCWLPADCVPYSSPQSLVELPDGTLLGGLGKVYTSRNQGHSWFYHPTYSNQLSSYKVINYGSHVFVQSNMNIQHSADNGVTWETVGTSINTISNEPFYVSKSAKLFISKISGVYMSKDFGQNWKNISTGSNGLGYSSYYYDFTETSNERVYAINNNHELWTSPDGGNTWTSSFVSYGYSSVFVDDNDDVYISKVGLNNQGDLYLKRANQNAGTVICSFPAPITNITKVNNVYYFLAGNGLIKTSDFITFQNIRSLPIQTYLITKSNTAIVVGGGIDIGKIFYNTNP